MWFQILREEAFKWARFEAVSSKLNYILNYIRSFSKEYSWEFLRLMSRFTYPFNLFNSIFCLIDWSFILRVLQSISYKCEIGLSSITQLFTFKKFSQSLGKRMKFCNFYLYRYDFFFQIQSLSSTARQSTKRFSDGWNARLKCKW